MSFMLPFYSGMNGTDGYGINSERNPSKMMPVHPLACLLKIEFHQVRIYPHSLEAELNMLEGRLKEQKQDIRDLLRNRLLEKIGKGRRRVNNQVKRKTNRQVEMIVDNNGETDRVIFGNLSVLNSAYCLEFYYLSRFHHDGILGLYADREDYYEKKESDDALAKYFDRTSDSYHFLINGIIKMSKSIYKDLEKASHKTKQFVHDNYLTCADCKSLYHKFCEELCLLQYRPLIIHEEDEVLGSIYICYECKCKRFKSETNHGDHVKDNNSNTVSTGSISDDTTLGSCESTGSGENKATKKRKSKKRRKKKKQQEPESAPIHNDDNSDDNDNQHQSKEKLRGDIRSSSPTNVNLTNDDWVDFLMKSGSIIALNEYMDRVLGVDDSKIPDNYDAE